MKRFFTSIAAILSVAVLSLAASTTNSNNGFCFDCWSSYWYGPSSNPIVCFIDEPDYIERTCTYTCYPPGYYPIPPEPFIVTFCDEPGICEQ